MTTMGTANHMDRPRILRGRCPRAVYIRVYGLKGKVPLLEIRKAIMGLQSILNYPYPVLPNIL
jgi:hypothetical protein